MTMGIKRTAMTTAVLAALANLGLAAVPADEAKQLGGAALTSFGSEKAGNKEGTIPPYSGEGVKVPAAYDAKEPGRLPDPYNEKPLFSINAQNYSKYLDKLDAQAELFKKFPNYRMDVYPSHRDWQYPKYIVDNTIKNATSCKATNKELKLEGCYGGFPFPIPKTGNEVMWNHLMQYESPGWHGISHSYVTPMNGQATLQTIADAYQEAPIFQQGKGVLPANDVFWKVLQLDVGPARKVGGKLVLIDSIDMFNIGRRVWQYIPGQRRVKLAPDLAYDTPSPNSGGASTMDDAKGFMGALDRYDFKLAGKKEKYIMYNNFNLTDYKVCPDEKTVNNTGFLHPDCARWELHRVWIVEATLKPGYRHIYAKRKFYWDEDAPGAGSVESYDASGKLYRVGFQMAYPYYAGVNGGITDATYLTDLQTGIWAIQGSLGIKGDGWSPAPPLPEVKYSPESLAGEGIR